MGILIKHISLYPRNSLNHRFFLKSDSTPLKNMGKSIRNFSIYPQHFSKTYLFKKGVGKTPLNYSIYPSHIIFPSLLKKKEVFRLLFVRMTGLEPACLSAPEPKSGVSANFTTSAFIMSHRLIIQGKFSVGRFSVLLSFQRNILYFLNEKIIYHTLPYLAS